MKILSFLVCLNFGSVIFAQDFTGLSGMVKVHQDVYLAVHDTKVFQMKPRVSLILISGDKEPVFDEIQFQEWANKDTRTSDLECLCKIPGTNDEFLLVEAGSWRDKHGLRMGKMLRVKIDFIRRTGSVIKSLDMPVYHENAKDAQDNDIVGDQLEGVACYRAGKNVMGVILAERGGSPNYPNALIRWRTYDLTADTFYTTPEGEAGKQVEDLGMWSNATTNRDISDLYLESDGTIWAVGCEEDGDAGPFYSVIYMLGKLSGKADDPVKLELKPWKTKEIPGFKVEALADKPDVVPGCRFAIGIDDEIYGNAWRGVRW